MVVGTERYLARELAASTQEIGASLSATVRLRNAAIGPYIDLYALGVIAIELLTGSSSLPRPISIAALLAWLRAKNPWLATAEAVDVKAIAALAFQLLDARSYGSGLQLRTISALFRSELSKFPKEADREPRISIVEAKRGDSGQEVVSAVRRIEILGRQLADQTAAFILKAGTIESLPDPAEDRRILSVIDLVFGNALRRTHAGWRPGVTMTIASFVILIAMIISGVTLTITTGQSQWALIFGGLSASTVLGTLIWRPYDRLFRATILTQQIEIIHVQTVVGLRGATTPESRVGVCKDTVAALNSLMDARKERRRK